MASIREFLIIPDGIEEASKHMYPSPLRVMRVFAQQVVRRTLPQDLHREVEHEAAPLGPAPDVHVSRSTTV